MKTIILGAGASYGFFSPNLTTDLITDAVRSYDNWAKVISRYNNLKSLGYDIVDAKTVTDIINRIPPQLDMNFEKIAEVIDKISSYGYDKSPKNNLFNLTLSLLIPDILKKTHFDHKWLPVPFLFRQIIAETILNHENNNKSHTYRKLICKQQEFFKWICKHDENVSIVSLNYDDCVYMSLKGLEFNLCFNNTAKGNGHQLDVNSFMSSNRVVYFPHGHIKFCYHDNRNASFCLDSNLAHKKRWEMVSHLGQSGSALFCTRGKFAYNFNTFITTGQTKDDSLNNQPYSVYYERLAIDIAKSDTIYLIGYSFGDDHFNRLLNSFLKISQENKVVVIDYYDLTKKIDLIAHFTKSEDNIIKKMCDVLDCDTSFHGVEIDKVVPDNQHEIDKLNDPSIGFGYIFDQVIYYRKGYESFLNEYNQVALSLR